MLEVRVEHAVGEHEVLEVQFTGSTPDRMSVVLPDTVHYHSIEVMHVGPQPAKQRGGVPVMSVGRPDRVHREFAVRNPICTRVVERTDLDLVTIADMRTGELLDALYGPSIGRIH